MSLRNSPHPINFKPGLLQQGLGDPLSAWARASWFGPGQQLAVLIWEGGMTSQLLPPEQMEARFVFFFRVYEGYHVFKTPVPG